MAGTAILLMKIFMPNVPQPNSPHHEEFSLPLFALTILVTLTGLFSVLWFFFPTLWTAQLVTPFWKVGGAFAGVSLINCFVEYFFHRYVLHTPAVPFLRRLYRQHTLHHGLTHIVRKQARGKHQVLFIENKFPIIEPEQHEASFFPWYSLAIFAVILTPVLALLQWLAPSFPWFLSGFLALASSLTLYELLHAINHWSLEKWLPLIEHPRWGKIWQPAYGFHLRHHAVIDCNESISGFFGLPVADWVFGTCVIPQTIYAQGEEWDSGKFRSPQPRALIRWLDVWADETVKKHRAAKAATSDSTLEASGQSLAHLSIAAKRAYTRGEEIANWLTHGIGLVMSVAGLTLLIVFASLRGDAWHVVSFTVFGLSLLFLYTASTLYHTWRTERGARLLLKLDHAAIFVLIAGSYTPFLLTSLRGPWGWSLFGVIWGLCGAGAVFQLIFGDRFRTASTLAYLFLGWLIVVAIKPLIAAVPAGGLWLLLAGGLCYTVGTLFYRWHRLRYHHAYWHTFVLAGSTCHLLAVLLFLLPSAR